MNTEQMKRLGTGLNGDLNLDTGVSERKLLEKSVKKWLKEMMDDSSKSGESGESGDSGESGNDDIFPGSYPHRKYKICMV